MFSSSTLIPFLPHWISSFSSNTSPPAVTDHSNRFSCPAKNDLLLFDSLNNMAPPPPPPGHTMVSANYADQLNPSASALNQSRKTVKKDRHSKIRTAQGLRDRRVRLSIGIARKFFDLQDMLGFQKASETLEWLLTKSNKDIKEVHDVSTNNNNNNGSCITAIAASSTCEVVSQIVKSNSVDLPPSGVLNEVVPQIGDVLSKTDSQKKLRRSSSLNVSVHMAKESRAKARARARERTRVKMYSKRSPRSDIVLDQNYCEKLKAATNYEQQQLEEEAGNKGSSSVTEESSLMVIKRNLMNSSPQNWDFSSAIARSSFCAITNINPSTGLHLCRKFWEAEGNYCPN